MHAATGGGLAYGDVAELFDCVSTLNDPAERRRSADIGQQVANERYGNPERFTAAVTAALDKVAPLATEMADR